MTPLNAYTENRTRMNAVLKAYVDDVSERAPTRRDGRVGALDEELLVE